MKKTLLSLFALAAFAISFAAPMVLDYIDGEQRWFYLGETTPLVGLPDCKDAIESQCAQLFYYNEATNSWEEVMINNEPVYEEGVKRN